MKLKTWRLGDTDLGSDCAVFCPCFSLFTSICPSSVPYMGISDSRTRHRSNCLREAVCPVPTIVQGPILIIGPMFSKAHRRAACLTKH
jgi:hypothetical protein